MWLLASLLGLGALGIASGAAFYLLRVPASVVSRQVALRLSPSTQLIAQRLADEPCNRTLAAQLVADLFQQAEYAALIAFSGQTSAKCGLDERLLSTVFSAQELNSDFAGAVRTGDQMVAAFPTDPTAYGWRSQAREKRGDLPGAYADYRVALSLFLDPSNVAANEYYNVARLAAKTGRPCDAIATMRDYVAFGPEQRRTQQIDTITREWQQAGSCPPLSGTGTAHMRFDPNASVIIVEVIVNGITGRMILDTGASRTLISMPFAERTGIEATDEKARIITANGKVLVFGGRADFLSVGGARLNSVPVFIQADSSTGAFGPGIDGLLGLSFLGNFRVHLGPGIVDLVPLEWR